jgi:DNA modification methylase
MTDKDWGDMSVTDVKKVSIPPCLAPSEIELNTTLIGDCRETLKQLPDGCINACITSPPYWGLRDYGTAEQLGLESTPEEYVKKMVAVFSEVRRTLRDDGTLWLNVGDSYSSHKDCKSEKQSLGLKNKDLVGIPWMLAFALRADGWYLRQDIIWHKPNPMPEPVTDRCTKAHEYIFLMSKKSKYFFDNEAIRVPYTEPINRWGGEKLEAKGHSIWDEGTGHKTYRDRNIRPNPEGKNKRSVWTVPTHSYKGAHFATFPPKLITPCILAGTSDKGCCADCGSPYERITGWEKTCKCETTEVEPCVVLDPFMGSGTTGMVAQSLGRSWIGCELNPEYVEMQMKRTSQQSLF